MSVDTEYVTEKVPAEAAVRAFEAAQELFRLGHYADAARMVKFYDPEPDSDGYTAKADLVAALGAHGFKVEPRFKVDKID